MSTSRDGFLEKTIAALRNDPYITDEALAQTLGLERPAAARFWRNKAQASMEGEHPMSDPTDTTDSERPDAQEPPEEPGFFSRLFFGRGKKLSGPAPAGAAAPLPVTDADYTVQTAAPSARLNTSTMNQEQLRIRRMNRIENAKFGRPAHETFMLFLLKIWLIIGPIAFVALTTGEVAYILTAMVPPGDTADYVITGGALFIDVAMMFVTFGVAIKRRDVAEKREANGGVVPKREEAEVWFGTLIWLVFAIINMVSQTAFLLHIISLSHDPNMSILYVFVASRVVGFILGDASTAFFLARVDNSEIKLIARTEREKGALYSDIAKAEGERQYIEAKSEADMRILRIEVEQKEQEALFMASLKRQMFQDILARRPQAPELDGPSRSRISRSDR